MKPDASINVIKILKCFCLLVLLHGCSNKDISQESGEEDILISISVLPLTQTIVFSETLQYSAMGTYADKSTKDLTTVVVWSSSNTSVATITDTGRVFALTEGTASIIATLGAVSGSTTLSVLYSEPQPKTHSMIIDHTCTRLNSIPELWIQEAKASLHIAYGHTSHGSQIITGMSGLCSWKGNLYSYNNSGTTGALDLRDEPFSGAYDLGNPTRAAWGDATRTYLNTHPEINVVMWSWCGQVSSATETDILTYLNLMNGLEDEYPNVHFVYMTGHLNGTGLTGNLHIRNEQIRNFCRDNGKVLYDFADIETYDPECQRARKSSPKMGM